MGAGAAECTGARKDDLQRTREGQARASSSSQYPLSEHAGEAPASRSKSVGSNKAVRGGRDDAYGDPDETTAEAAGRSDDHDDDDDHTASSRIGGYALGNTLGGWWNTIAGRCFCGGAKYVRSAIGGHQFSLLIPQS